MTSRAPLLVLGVGNPSRGDDALGPAFLARLEEELAPALSSGEIELLTDFQLQIEHALDLEGRERVIFVDASVTAPPPFSFRPIEARRSPSAVSHALSPEAVLSVVVQLGRTPPEAFVLAIRGERFELGEGLGEGARGHLDAAVAFFLREVAGRAAPLEGAGRPDQGSGAGAPT